MSGRKPTTAEVRFEEKCAPRASGCIEWTGGTHKKGPLGYGMFYADGQMRPAHRWAYEKAHGTLIPGLDVCHRCDNRLCVNLKHLFAGTRKHNMEDAVQKGRMDRLRKPKGEAHGRSTITEEKVRAMREIGGKAEVAEIARQFETTYMVAYRVIHRFTWKHI